jgi:hypothetical protein
MRYLAIAFAAGVLLSAAALAQQDARDSDRYGRHHRSHQKIQAPVSAPRAGDPDPYAPKAGAPDPYALRVGAPNPYATRGGDPNPYATRGGDPVPALPGPGAGAHRR